MRVCVHLNVASLLHEAALLIAPASGSGDASTGGCVCAPILVLMPALSSWKWSKGTWMWHLGTSLGGEHGSQHWVNGLSGLRGLFQPSVSL